MWHHFFHKLAYLGCEPIQSRSDKRMISLNNVCAMAGAGFFLYYAIFYALYNIRVFMPVLVVYCLAIPCIMTTIYLNYRKKYLSAGIWMNLASSVPVFLNSWFFLGHKVGTHYFFILFSMMPIFTLGNRKKRLILLLSFMNLLFFFLIYAYAPDPELSKILTAELLIVTNYLSILFSLIFAIIVPFVYQQILYKSEMELEEKTETLIKAFNTVNQLATMDGLTAIFNRRHLDQQIQLEITRADRYGTPLSVIMFDLDHFKSVNDCFGHAIGDEVLISVSNLAASCLRITDLIGRWGGEEFFIAMPQTDIHGARLVAEKLRIILENTHHNKAGFVTGSFGVAEWKHGETADMLYKRVDNAMYTAKSQGRNQVFF